MNSHTNHMNWTGHAYAGVREVYIAALETIIRKKNRSNTIRIFDAKEIKAYFAAVTKHQGHKNMPLIEVELRSNTICTDCQVIVNIDWSSLDAEQINSRVNSAKRELAGMEKLTVEANADFRKVEIDAKLIQNALVKQSNVTTLLSACLLAAIVAIICLA